MDVFASRDYRKLIRSRIELLPNKGYGQLSRLAKHLDINATLVSQVLSGAKNFTEDQAFRTAEFFDFTESETTYFLLLVQRERAGDHRLKKLFEKQAAQMQRNAQQVKARVRVAKELSFEEQAVFYSDWLYTSVHTLSSIERFQGVDAIADHLKLPRTRVVEVANWLLQRGLCKEESGRLKIGPATTFVSRNSPLASRHHSNWRQKAIESMSKESDAHLFFTAPFSVSVSDYAEVRKELVELIDRIAKRVSKTQPEVMATINIDLFQT